MQVFDIDPCHWANRGPGELEVIADDPEEPVIDNFLTLLGPQVRTPLQA